MMNWLRKNPALLIGIGMPLLLVVVFVLAAWFTKVSVEPPKYDAVFLTGYYEGSQNALGFNVSDGRARFFARGSYVNQQVKAFRYSPATDRTVEIRINIPEEIRYRYDPNGNSRTAEDKTKITPISVPEIEALKLDTSIVAPDGYTFNTSASRNSRGLVSEIFRSRRYDRMASLTKDGNRVTIASPGDENHYYYNVTFLGWVVP